MSLQWFRFYAEAVDNEKLRLLAFDDRWHFVALLCLKAQGVLDERNKSLRQQKICIKLGLDSVALETAMKRLVTVGLVTSTWQPTNWAKRQFLSDSSTNRVRAFRERFRNVAVTPPDTDTDTDTDTEQKQNKNQEYAQRHSVAGEFAEFQSVYPKRSGSQRWGDAKRFFAKRLAEGHSAQTILAGAYRYAAWVTASGKDRTEHVLQAATFLGDNKGFLEPYDLPKKPESDYERMIRNLTTDDNQVIEHETARAKLSLL